MSYHLLRQTLIDLQKNMKELLDAGHISDYQRISLSIEMHKVEVLIDIAESMDSQATSARLANIGRRDD